MIEWDSFTGVLGDEVSGIWEKYTNKTDINAADVNFNEKCIVTGDGLNIFNIRKIFILNLSNNFSDFGLVKLFRFPSLKKGNIL
jgi:hypothetical protein